MALFSFLNAATATTVHKITWLISRFVLLAVTVRPTLASLRSRGLPFIKIDDDAPLDKIARPNNKTQAALATDSESLNFRSAPFKSQENISHFVADSLRKHFQRQADDEN